MNKLLSVLFVSIFFLSIGTSRTVIAQTQPTPSMQEQYDKLHGIKPKTQTTNKSKTTPQKSNQPAKPMPAPEVVSEGGVGIKVGIRGGVNYSSVTSDAIKTDGITIDHTLCYFGGLMVEIGGERFSVQPEVLYSQTGYKISASKSGSLLAGESRLNTVTVPLLFKVALGNGSTKFFINGGGYGSYALSGWAKQTFNGITNKTKLTFDAGDQRLEYGAVGGAGVSLALGIVKLLIEGRYYYGLGSDGNIAVANKLFTRNIQGSVGLLIPLGGN